MCAAVHADSFLLSSLPSPRPIPSPLPLQPTPPPAASTPPTLARVRWWAHWQTSVREGGWQAGDWLPRDNTTPPSLPGRAAMLLAYPPAAPPSAHLLFQCAHPPPARRAAQH